MPALPVLLLAAATMVAARDGPVRPDAITFTILHADCGTGSHSFDLIMNGELLATVPTSQPCGCNARPLVVTLTGPAATRGFEPHGCNSFEVVPSDPGILLGFARVAVEHAAGSTALCLHDASSGSSRLDCGDRELCDFPGTAIAVAGGRDVDGDGVPGGIGPTCDVCPHVSDPGQEDADGDGIGDACAPAPEGGKREPVRGPGGRDGDGDGLRDAEDNCERAPNPDQADADRDGWGDACDLCEGRGPADADRDGFCDLEDNCIQIANPGQQNSDGDDFGDACDSCPGPGGYDSDADGLCDGEDNCPLDPNPGQEDGDGDGAGDACDPPRVAGAGRPR